MKNGKFGFGIIGCGIIGGAHANAIKAVEEAELVAVCDVDEPKGRAFGEQHGCTNFYKNYLEMVKDPAVDIVSICTPSGIHGAHHSANVQPFDCKRGSKRSGLYHERNDAFLLGLGNRRPFRKLGLDDKQRNFYAEQPKPLSLAFESCLAFACSDAGL